MYYLIILGIVILDQWSKRFMTNLLLAQDPIIIIKDFFKLTLVHNRGAAFGILQNKRFLFILLTIVAVVAIIIVLVKNRKRWSPWELTALSFIAGGAVGNAIDRVSQSYVVDFFSFTFFKRYDFAVFNVADIFVVIGTILLLLKILISGDGKNEG